MKTLVSILFALLCIGVLCQTGGATIRHVTSQYATIQAAINAAVIGDTVLVDEGTYKENIVITKKITVGSAFVLDGDTSHISRTIIDGSQPSNPNAAAVVTIDGATDTTTVLSGFTITGGKGNLRTVNYPGIQSYQMIVGTGVDIAGGGARIHHNIVRANNCDSPTEPMGGVINIFDTADKNGVSYAIVEHNSIADNTLVGKDCEGGAFAIGHNSTIRDNVIARNTIQGLSAAGFGAGFEIWNGIVKIERNRIINNRASHEGGGLYAVAVPIAGVAPTIEMVNNILAGNIAGTSGGGLFVSVIGASVVMINNTLVSNIGAHGGAGVIVQTGAIIRALNTILWDSSASEVVAATGGSFVASYCDVAGGFTGTGNINADPVFVSGDPMFNLYKTSPCIGGGIDSTQLGGGWCYAPPFDFNGDPRHRPVGPQQCDIGAQEEQLTVDVRVGHEELPIEFALGQNYPNPFNPSTSIGYTLAGNGHEAIGTRWVKLVVYDMLGREVAVLVNERKAPGSYEVKFDASNLASGVYLYRLTAGQYVECRKMVLMR